VLTSIVCFEAQSGRQLVFRLPLPQGVPNFSEARFSAFAFSNTLVRLLRMALTGEASGVRGAAVRRDTTLIAGVGCPSISNVETFYHRSLRLSQGERTR
jgi:hypothetical protein